MARNKSATTPDDEFFADPAHSMGYLSRIAFRSFSRALERRTMPYGVSAGQWRFLRVLWTEDGITQRELSFRVGMREPTTVAALKSLERSKLVYRRQSVEDRRRVHVFLTAKAKRLQKTLLPYVAEVNRLALAGLSPAEVETLRHGLRVMAQNLALDNVEPVEEAAVAHEA